MKDNTEKVIIAVYYPTCNTSFILLVAAAPSVCLIDPRVVRAHSVCVVTAGFPQGREPVIQFIHTLEGERETHSALLQQGA